MTRWSTSVGRKLNLPKANSTILHPPSHDFQSSSTICTTSILTMRFFCLATLVAAATAFTSAPNAFTTTQPAVGERASFGVVDQSTAHRNRRATIVMDGKANGEFLRGFCTRDLLTHAFPQRSSAAAAARVFFDGSEDHGPCARDYIH